MKKTTIYVLIGILAITNSCKEADQKKVPNEEKEVFVTDSSYNPEEVLATPNSEAITPLPVG